MSLQYAYGIDMGTSTVKIYSKKGNSITRERNMIAIRDKETVFAVGNDAYEMEERTPENIQIIHPMCSGRINDILMMEAVLHTLLGKNGGYLGYRPSLYFSVPMDMTELEKRTYSSIAHKGRLKRCRVFLVEKPIADALALSIPIHHTKGTLLVNIGAESTEMSVIADGHVVISRLVPLGGKQFDEAVTAAVRRNNELSISQRTAVRLKHSLVNLDKETNEGRKVMGIDAESGLPRDGLILSGTVTNAVRRQLIDIAKEIRKFLERMPPQIRDAISRDGIYLTGGSTQIPGLEHFFSAQLDYLAHISPQYDLSTVSGLKRIICQPELQHWAFDPKRKF